MTRRSLLIGSQTGGLSGPDGDVRIVAEALTDWGFACRTITGDDATRAGILAAYDDLVQDCSAGDAAVVYYSGHGGRDRIDTASAPPGLPDWLHYIVPTDAHLVGPGVFGGILAEELSALALRLTERTDNVTTILDCCHSARMFRGESAVPKAVPGRTLGGRELPADLRARWEAARAASRSAVGDANPKVVQLVACAPDQSAYELTDDTLQDIHGTLTSALVPVLRSPVARQLSWTELIGLVRPAVLDRVSGQRPDLLGPNGARRLFEVTTKDETGVLPVAEGDGRLWLAGAALLGIAEGDTYELVTPDGAAPLAEAVVSEVRGDRALLDCRPAPPSPLPAGTTARPVEVSLGRRPVLLRPAGAPEAAEVLEALRPLASARVTTAAVAGPLATLDLDDHGMMLLDSGAEPLWPTRRPVTAGSLRVTADALGRLARATYVRDLSSGTGADGLPDDVAVSLSRLDGAREVPVAPGEHVYAGDALVVRAHNTADVTRYVSVLDIGLAGAVTILTDAEPSGATVTAGETLVVGETPTHELLGLELYWPDTLPATGPRPESYVVLVADKPVDGLRSLEQSGVRGPARGPAASELSRLIDGLASGTRDSRPKVGGAPATRYRVLRLDFVLHPTPRPADADEPAFEIDERPDPSFRLITPRALTPVPEQVTVRLSDLVVRSNRALLRAKVRVDTLVVTAAPDGASAVQSRTFFVDRVKDGDRLPLDDVVLFDGPVHRFLDVAVWVAKADQHEVELSDLLHTELHDEAVAGALTTLAGLAVAAPTAAVIVGAAAAVATVVRTAARLISAAAGTSIGVYRTSLLPHERFGAGAPARRHPEQGLRTAQDVALAFEVIDAGG